jgi:hypothetical protein
MALDHAGNPVIRNRPETENWFTTPTLRGTYCFDYSWLFDKREMYETYSDRAWALAASAGPRIEPGDCDDDWPPPESAQPRYKVPVSVFWLSRCGKYCLFPDPRLVPPGGLERSTTRATLLRLWLPDEEWDEYYIVPAIPGRKYLYKNRRLSLIYRQSKYQNC